jgi:hypothetical protein
LKYWCHPTLSPAPAPALTPALKKEQEQEQEKEERTACRGFSTGCNGEAPAAAGIACALQVSPMSQSTASIVPQLQELIGRFGLELAVVEVGKDRGLLPINSFSLEFTELCAAGEVHASLRVAATALRGWIDRLFDTTALFDEPTIALLSR